MVFLVIFSNEKNDRNNTIEYIEAPFKKSN